ncbi:succinate CoA transferase [Parabacteroides sp. PF5-5]|uniref:succinate CoA transferase n=1 Tax=unclassified Parabacteroides TaxID=2649774 RepID=UPI0024765A2E|nr:MULTISPECIES: succinate CoA transferase [unclassified Parabacteroides]MDH6303712.1 succinate CoA transferase [Parabacteroides sp. PH5-39]MDH6314329.1 succinate CoA transferase [Parabacteroides sp. PF5-13]MDH6318607.1 succinate CoA transferase [Parabacteroides sp. PH5-13]MDH6322101.1 succinate CoA transferase [Parabacteroides sp. PH5-8]MDH6325820.1 succinate CoA transferase [Parabacteroides sp. PH5-41]
MAIERITAKEAALRIKHNDQVGFSGFTHAGCPKIVPLEIAKLAQEEHEKGNPFEIAVFTGASTGDNIDGALARANAIKFRTPYQTNNDIRNEINKGVVSYFDLHLSSLAQDLRYGFYGDIDVAVIEASDVTEDGKIIPTSGVGIAPTIVRMAKLVIVELNSWHPKELRGIHDLLDLQDPPYRKEIPITNVKSRIGKDYIQVDSAKIVIVETNVPNDGGGFAPVDDITSRIGKNTADFLVNEVRRGTIPKKFLPIQSGVGNIANAVLAAMGDNKDIPNFEVYTEVIQDAIIDLLEKGRITYASGGTLTVSNPYIERIYKNLPFFKERIVLRTSEISNNPEVIRRLGIISMNTAIEADIFGNINSTHITGSKIMNGLGGSGDFTRNAYLSIFLTPSTAKNGDISAIVPMVSHVDHNEHSVKVIITEHGVADLRGKSPKERAVCVIENCSHPDYRPLLYKYLESGAKGQTPVNLQNAFAFHNTFIKTGSMKNTCIS